ncbi:MAG TPA: glycoside hydrolase family 3 N-terminal domain-containing protein [Candidatus Acidoferrales bacterium]|jgi:beta-N-acetylhexosaminidase|nr:glycoside hydrolase family 3 N-terminal domain-containing protein [Candidatus Acidoferrales bacterium]
MSETAALARGVILTGFDGERPPDSLPQFAGYILFARNGTNVAAARGATDAIRAAYPREAPPLIGIDQEGGRVARLQTGIETMPSMMALGAAGDPDLAARAGEQTAFDVRRAGATMDFAPVLDLALDPANTVIGTRSFGADPQRVASLGAALAAGLLRGGVLPCYKHFPGHGATAVDSHDRVPVVDAGAAALRARDLAPFAAIARGARAIMGAHLIARAFDPDNPATRSRILIDLLRGEFGFTGAYVTDCLHMGAAAEEDGTVSAAVAALAAGADLLLISHSIDMAHEAVDRIVAAVNEGSLPLARLEEASARVRVLRRDGAAPLPLDSFAPHPGIGREIARRGITLVRGIPHADPLTSFVVSFESATAEGAQGAHALHASLKREAPVIGEAVLSLEPSTEQVDAALDRVRAGGRRPIVLSRRAHVYPAQAAAIERIVALDRDALVVSMREPFDVPLFAGARHVLAAYGDDAASVGALADVLFGGSIPGGTMPVELAHG